MNAFADRARQLGGFASQIVVVCVAGKVVRCALACVVSCWKNRVTAKLDKETILAAEDFFKVAAQVCVC